jgi:hypothetical protein
MLYLPKHIYTIDNFLVLIQWVPKVWERTTEPYGKRKFSQRSQKSNFRQNRATKFFFVVNRVWIRQFFFPNNAPILDTVVYSLCCLLSRGKG